MHCPVCSHDNSILAEACEECGAQLTGGQILPSPEEAPAPQPPSEGEGEGPGSQFLVKGTRLQSERYMLGIVLAQDSLTITYKGGDTQLRRYLAIKEFFPAGSLRRGTAVDFSGALDEENCRRAKVRFVEEAQSLAELSDAGIVRVYGTLEENNTVYMVTELLEGKSLAALLAARGILSEEHAVEIITRVARALRVAHQANLVHCDLRPENIFLTRDERVVLINFGAARAFAGEKSATIALQATSGYMAPEQQRGQAQIGPATDIYALGAILYQCVTRRHPPSARERAGGTPLEEAHELNPNISEELSRAITRALQLKTGDRPGSVDEFLEALPDGGTLASPSSQNDARHASPARRGTGGQAAEWYYGVGEEEVGPVAQAQLVQLIRNGTLTGETQVWCAGMPEWQIISATKWAKEVPARPAMAVAAPVAAEPGPSQNKLATSMEPLQALECIRNCFVHLGADNNQVDTDGLRVTGTHGVKNTVLTAQVTREARGTRVLVQCTPPGSAAAVLERRLNVALTTALRNAPAASAPPPQAAPGEPQGCGSASAARLESPMPTKQGSTILVLALLGIFCCGPLAVVAWVKGNNALADYGTRDPGDRNLVVTGRAIGMVATVIWCLFVLLLVAAIIKVKSSLAM
jgi:hypothetical protein